jgi:YydF family exported signaling peptide
MVFESPPHHCDTLRGGEYMDATQSLLESFVIDDKVAELKVVDDLWYFIAGGSGRWIVGSG